MLTTHYTLNDSRTEIKLNLSTRHEWLQDDSFFKKIIMQCNFSEPIYFVLDRMQDGSLETMLHLETRIIPNLIYSLKSSLGYEPSIGVLREYTKDYEPPSGGTELDYRVIDGNLEIFGVSIVSEPVNPDCVIQPQNEVISTTQPKTTTKRKKKNDN
jgi:hypothetical protein